jgi:hypothetical protein
MIHGKKRNKDLFRRLTENWGYTKSEETPLDEQMAQGEEEEEEVQAEGVFDANHYCIHHGGVHHNGEVAMAEAVQHVAPDADGRISHYDMKLKDGTILENVAAEDIQVTNASLATEHQMKRDHDAYKKDDEEELEEGGAAARAGNEEKDNGKDRMHADRVHEAAEEEEELEEMATQAGGAVGGAGAVAPGTEEEEEEETPQPVAEAEEEDEDAESLEEAIRRVVTKVLSDIITK